MLGVVADRQIGRAGDLAFDKRMRAGEAFDERGLARTVGAEQSDAVTGVQHQLELLEQHRFAVTDLAAHHACAAGAAVSRARESGS